MCRRCLPRRVGPEQWKAFVLAPRGAERGAGELNCLGSGKSVNFPRASWWNAWGKGPGSTPLWEWGSLRGCESITEMTLKTVCCVGYNVNTLGTPKPPNPP